jgi:hypothetical protein
MTTDIASVPGEPVGTESMASSVGQGDLPMDGGGRAQMVVETAPSRARNKLLIPGAIILVIVMLATIIGLSVGLTQSNNANNSDVNSNLGDDGKGKSPISSPTAAPAVVAKKLKNVKDFVLVQQYSTSASFDDANSPQSRAANFMAQGDMEVPTTDSTSQFATYKWMEEYALAVFYYTTGGPSWISQSDFFNPNYQTCGWFLMKATPVGPFREGAFCATSGIVDSIQFST